VDETASGLGGFGSLGLFGLLLSPFEEGEATLTFDYLVGLLAHGMKGKGRKSQISPPGVKRDNGSPSTILSPAIVQR
jgi:hypothetical protein